MRHVDLPQEEEKVLKHWHDNDVFEKTLKATKDGKPFVFYEGPPTANGKPGLHHVLARSFKDIVCRFQTMKGRYVLRRAGWDTHGLPVEIEVEKKLGLKNKREVEKYGIAQFNKECQISVWQYKDEWEKLTRRMGYWLDLKNPYITYEPQYIESLWNIIKRIYDKKLLVKDYKVVPFCVRCGTPISSHEVAQGYETVTDKSVIIKFKVKNPPAGGENTFLLAWTTTPWTLPGNVALAVGPKVTYVEVEANGEKYILARDLAPKVFGEAKVEYKINKELTSSELTRLSYEPLFAVKELESENSYRVYEADFVTTADGTGIVHTAVMYGVDDFELGSKLNLPKFHTVNREGVFVKSVPIVGGLAVVSENKKDPITEKTILFYLKKQNLLFNESSYKHEYPFCWRCKSPLLYYAQESWFIKMSALRNDLIKNNEKVNWVPEHIKDGRFGEWLREVKDWAISRERYWGTPLPIWACTKCEHKTVIGSLAELNEHRLDSPTTLILMRHGEAESNAKGICSAYPEKILNPLTEKGRKQAEASAQNIKKLLAANKVSAIYSSDLLRARETAQILADELKIKEVIFDERLREINTGEFNGGPFLEYEKYFNSFKDKFIRPAPAGESWLDVAKRVREFMMDVSREHAGKKVVVVSHMDPLFLMQLSNGIYGEDETKLLYQNAVKDSKLALSPAEFTFVETNNWPHDEEGNLNLHRPYADSVFLKCSMCSSKMERIKDLADVWFDSGAMPWASQVSSYAHPSLKATEWHSKASKDKKNLNIKNKNLPKDHFPADYICEAIDQTRGWFYTLMAVSTALGEGNPYKNVISLNHVLDEKGEKMSKSKGNIVDPWLVGEKVGFDMMRWYFYTVNAPGDNKLFSLRDIESKKRRFADTLINSFLFLETYYTEAPKSLLAKTDILDKWVLIKTEMLEFEVNKFLESYDITSASRAIEAFIDELSNWYIRRSRRKFQKQNIDAEKLSAQNTLTEVLKRVSVVMGPFAPFISEWLYQELRGLTQGSARISADKNRRLSAFGESVHLEKWPNTKTVKASDITKVMDRAREIVALGLAERAQAGLRVRQPLNALYVSPADYNLIGDVLYIVAEELNVKKVLSDRKIEKNNVNLDTELTAELKEEGMVREMIRNINEMRKEAKLTPEDKIILHYELNQNANFKELLTRWEQVIKAETRSTQINFGITEHENFLVHKVWNYEGFEIGVGIKNI
ncbi:MAG: class I tRNA ligase family protein [bacterium]|nr:class I tRNA ligase family protein [bacterium]